MCSATYSCICATNVDLSQSHVLGANVITATMGCSPGRERAGENFFLFSFLQPDLGSMRTHTNEIARNGMQEEKAILGNQLRSPSLFSTCWNPVHPRGKKAFRKSAGNSDPTRTRAHVQTEGKRAENSWDSKDRFFVCA